VVGGGSRRQPLREGRREGDVESAFVY